IAGHGNSGIAWRFVYQSVLPETATGTDSGKYFLAAAALACHLGSSFLDKVALVTQLSLSQYDIAIMNHLRLHMGKYFFHIQRWYLVKKIGVQDGHHPFNIFIHIPFTGNHRVQIIGYL